MLFLFRGHCLRFPSGVTACGSLPGSLPAAFAPYADHDIHARVIRADDPARPLRDLLG